MYNWYTYISSTSTVCTSNIYNMYFQTPTSSFHFDQIPPTTWSTVAEISDLRPFLMTDKRAWVLGNSDFTTLLCWWLWEAYRHHGNLFPGGFDFNSKYHLSSELSHLPGVSRWIKSPQLFFFLILRSVVISNHPAGDTGFMRFRAPHGYAS